MSERRVPSHKISSKEKLKFVRYYQETDAFFPSIKRAVRNPLLKGVQVKRDSYKVPLSSDKRLPNRKLFFTVILEGYWFKYDQDTVKFLDEKDRKYAPKYSYNFMKQSIVLSQGIYEVNKNKFVYSSYVSIDGLGGWPVFVHVPLDLKNMLDREKINALYESDQAGLDPLINLFQRAKNFELASRPHWVRVANQLSKKV